MDITKETFKKDICVWYTTKYIKKYNNFTFISFIFFTSLPPLHLGENLRKQSKTSLKSGRV